MRDMQDIMKLHFVAPLLRQRAEKAKAKFNEHVASYAKKNYGTELFSCMEYADHLFRHAAEQKLWTFLARYCEQVHENLSYWIAHGAFDEWKADALKNSGHRERARVEATTEENALDVTQDMMQVWVREEFQHLSALPRSTSPSHVMMEQVMLQVVMEFQRDCLSYYTIVREAQRQDPEWVAWHSEECARAETERVTHAAEQALQEKLAEEARTDVKRAVKKGTATSMLDAKARLGWPTKADVVRIRNDELRAFVEKAHEVKVEL